MYADDTHLTYADNNVGSIESCLSEALLNVHTWLKCQQTYSKYDQNRIYADRIWPKAKDHCCFPLNLNERYSGKTGCNYEITWHNN